jgi:hypothetical protein
MARVDMLQDRRRAPRHSIGRRAHIRDILNQRTSECLITDISDRGVRLLIDGVQVPDSFTLYLNPRPCRRECRVAWRLGCEVGAEFIDGYDADFARRMLTPPSI